KEAMESQEKTEVTSQKSSTVTPVRPTIKSDEEASIDAQEEITKPKTETIPLKNEVPSKEEEIVQKTEPTQKKKKQKKKLDSAEFFTIQLGAFGTEEQAQKFKEKILSQTKISGGRYSPKIVQKGELFVVLLGRYASKEEASEAKSKLDANLQSNAFVRPLK
ncbi:MAG: SPOR domain-containing protein, partial [Leptospiraceae bacterium]|nr:SPOR domain-containing protein [Leptospiraceae bacterium]